LEKDASEMLAKKKLSVFECNRKLKKSEKMCKMTKEVGSQKHKRLM
jgi:hypothetical protein